MISCSSWCYKIFQNAQTEKINNLLVQILSLEETVSTGKETAEKFVILQSEIHAVNLAHAELQKNLEALEQSHSSTLEIKTNLENSLLEKNNLAAALQKEIKEITDNMSKASASHDVERENFLNNKKNLKDQLEAARQTVTAAKGEVRSRREEIKIMKATLTAASNGLKERDDTIKELTEKLNKAGVEQTKTSELLKEKSVAMNKIKV